jgi:hypothetical protein
MNDKRVERQLIAWSWRAELCDAMVLGAIESAPPDSVEQKETKGSQEILLRLKIRPSFSSLPSVKNPSGMSEARTFRSHAPPKSKELASCLASS